MKEKEERVLSAAEKRRAEKLEKYTVEMEQQGYTPKDLIISISKANIFAVFLLIPLFIIGYGLYYIVNREFDFSRYNLIVLLVLIVVLTVIHELIHGTCWSIFTPHRFKDIEFGFMKSSLTPYCTCLVPLKKGQYILGTVMPLILLGIIPMIVGIVIGNPNALFIGIIMADAAAGDIMVIDQILRHRSNAKNIVYLDHPTEAGLVVFER